jgi:hypothetical protein
MPTDDHRPPLAGSTAGTPFVGHKSRFIRRTLWATLITLGLVALYAAVYGSLGWGMWYLLAGLWAVVLFALTPLILKAALFDHRPGRALGLVAAKLGWMTLILAGLWIDHPGLTQGSFAGALIAGVSTPLAVVLLRAIGAAMAGRQEGRGDAPGTENSPGRGACETES